MKKSLLAALIIIPIALLLLFNLSDSPASDSQQSSQTSSSQNSEGNSASTDQSRYVGFVSLDRDANEQTRRVLFFKADWCITCNNLEDDIEENASSIPEDVQIVRVDFDRETELKQKYDVRQQHTLVQIDDENNIVNKWVLSPTLEHVLERVERT